MLTGLEVLSMLTSLEVLSMRTVLKLILIMTSPITYKQLSGQAYCSKLLF